MYKLFSTVLQHFFNRFRVSHVPGFVHGKQKVGALRPSSNRDVGRKLRIQLIQLAPECAETDSTLPRDSSAIAREEIQ